MQLNTVTQSITIAIGCSWWWWQKGKDTNFPLYVKWKAHSMFKHFKSIVRFATVFLCIFIFDYSYFISCSEQRIWTILLLNIVWYSVCILVIEQSNEANMNLHFEQWIRSVQLNTNLLPLTRNNISVKINVFRLPFLPPISFHFWSKNYNNFFKIEEFRNIYVFGWLLIMLELYAIS